MELRWPADGPNEPAEVVDGTAGRLDTVPGSSWGQCRGSLDAGDRWLSPAVRGSERRNLRIGEGCWRPTATDGTHSAPAPRRQFLRLGLLRPLSPVRSSADLVTTERKWTDGPTAAGNQLNLVAECFRRLLETKQWAGVGVKMREC